MHYWGDEWFDKNGDDLNTAISYCMHTWKKYARIGSHGKEKFGTFRHHEFFWNGGLHGLIWPGYSRIVSPFLYWNIDPIIKFITKWFGIRWLGRRWQRYIYNYTIQKMCKKYPNITDELVMDSSVPHWIKGKVDGQIIHDRHWKTIKQEEKQ
jgi:hypothetical protein